MDPVIASLVNILILIVAAGIICICIKWAIGYFEIPHPVDKIIWGVVILVCLIALLRMLGFVGGGRFPLA